MLFLAASKGTFLQWTLEHDVARRSPERGQKGEHCSSTEFSSAAEVYSKCKSRAVRDWYSLLTSKPKQKLPDEEKASRIE